MPTATARIDTINLVAIPSTDQDRSIDFYVEHLGSDKGTDVPFGNGDRWVEVYRRPARRASRSRRRRTALQTGISLTTPDIDAPHARLRAAGVDVDAEISRYGAPVPPRFWLRDPDANALLVVEVL